MILISVRDILSIWFMLHGSVVPIVLVVMMGRVIPIIPSAAVELSLPTSPSGEIPLLSR